MWLPIISHAHLGKMLLCSPRTDSQGHLPCIRWARTTCALLLTAHLKSLGPSIPPVLYLLQMSPRLYLSCYFFYEIFLTEVWHPHELYWSEFSRRSWLADKCVATSVTLLRLFPSGPSSYESCDGHMTGSVLHVRPKIVETTCDFERRLSIL